MMSEKELDNWLKVAKEAALIAGRFLLKCKGSAQKVNIESGRDIKIEADLQSERLILDYLKKHSEFSILSEEKGLIVGGDKNFIWIVDPLDGSLNYLRGIPLSCVSIGLWYKENSLLGIVYDFNRSELFSGIAKKGGWLNKRPLKVSNIVRREKAVLFTGFPVNTDFTPEGIRAFVEQVHLYKKVRMLGSAALSIAYVASGRADIYQEKDIMLWDVAGAIPILLGAGGKLNMERATRLYSYDVFVSSGTF